MTGCSTGTGFATALRLAAEGFDVLATMRRPDRDGPALLEAAHAAGTTLRLGTLDVTDDDSVQRAFDQAGDVDLVVNNAAIMWFGSTEETGLDRWTDVFDTNLFGAVRCMRAALPGFRARGGGCIINISSAAGSVALPAIGAYASSKAALEAASEMVAMEGHQHNIRVVVIQTGATATAMGAKGQPPNRDSPYWASTRNTLTFLAAQQPNISSPDEIADAVARAASDPTTPFRLAVGQGSADLIHARSAMTDEEWIATAGGTTDIFTSRYQQATGINLRPR